MTDFRIVPTIELYRDFDEFIQKVQITNRDLIITDRFLNDTFITSKNLQCRCICQDDFGPGEPSDEKVTKILEIAYAQPYSRIIAIGGGTAIDIAKLVCLSDVTNILDLYQGRIPLKREKELIVIPTTCGTGSEVTNISIVAFKQLNTKLGLAKDELFANTAALIPEFLIGLPYNVFVFSSVDALIHAVESYLSPKANDITNFFSEKAIKMILGGYLELRQRGNDYRKEIMDKFILASTYAGIAFSNAGCGLIHAMSYPLSGEYHIAHGEANHQMFLSVMHFYNKNKYDEKFDKLYAIFAEIFGCGIDIVESKFEELVMSLINRKPLSTYGATVDTLRTFAEQVISTQQRLLTNAYVQADIDTMVEIYKPLL